MHGENSLKVVFCDNRNVITDNEIDTIFIWPSDNGWNDFKFKTYGSFSVLLSNNKTITGDILVAVSKNNAGLKPSDFESNQIEKLLLKPSYTGIGNKHFSEQSKIKDNRDFFTMLPNMEAYRSIVRKVGVEYSYRLLNAINDLVYVNEYKNKELWLEKATNSDVFQKSFLRNSEPYFAYYNAADILKGLEFEEFGYLSNTLDLSFKLDGFTQPHELKLRFEPDGLLPQRINILIGENGLGKSQTLSHFIKSALQQRGYADNLVDPSHGFSRPMINRLITIATPGETSNTFPAESSIKNPKTFYRRLNLTRNGRLSPRQSLGKSLVLLARTDESISQLYRWDIFIEAIKNSLQLDKIVIPLSENDLDLDCDHIPLKKLRGGWNEERRLKIWSSIADNAEPKIVGDKGNYHQMSSGQLSFFKFALLACLHIDNGSYVLLDEPETHLHPSFISNFITLLDNILDSAGAYALIATHSPYFVREVAREQVHVYKKDSDGFFSISNPRLKTFGANISDISDFVFGDEVESTLSNKIIARAKSESFSYADIKGLFSSYLPTEMLHHIKFKLEEK